jgi:hypothetical protein
MEIASTRVKAGVVEFALQHRDLDGGRPGSNADQGVTIQVVGEVGGKEREILRFDCFDQHPHYHYDPENKNENLTMDATTAGNPVGWTMRQLREKLPDMLKRAGCEDLASQLDGDMVATKLDEVESIARGLAIKERNNVTHNRGDVVIEAGAIRFGLEFRTLAADGGQAIHVLGDVAGQEIELLAFDCFRNEPHYHYGPRNKNERIFWDRTLVPDTLRWTLDQFKEGRLAAMIGRAGYPGIVAELDNDLVQSKLPEVEAQAMAMINANSG